MWTMIQRFFTDETFFTGLIRGSCLALGVALDGGHINLAILPDWLGMALIFLGGLIRAGDKNPR